MVNKPLVSVTVLCYNFENYISNCLLSVVQQKTNFDFEIIIGDDNSTDGSRAIIEDFAREYPDLIKTVFWDVNVGAKKNMAKVIEVSRGDYIAYCDGDDYFYPGKLQSQVDVFRKHPECALVFHKVCIVDSFGKTLGFNGNRTKKRISSIEDLVIYGNYITHSSKAYRRSALSNLGFSKYSSARAIDYYCNIVNASFGSIIYIDQVLGAYRKHGAGVDSAPIETKWRNFYANHRALRAALDAGVDSAVIKAGYAAMYMRFATIYARGRRYATANKLMEKSFKCKYLGFRQIGFMFIIRFPVFLRYLDK